MLVKNENTRNGLQPEIMNQYAPKHLVDNTVEVGDSVLIKNDPKLLYPGMTGKIIEVLNNANKPFYKIDVGHANGYTVLERRHFYKIAWVYVITEPL